MVSLAFHLFVVGSYFWSVLVVVHSFVADNSLLDCCDYFFLTLCFQVGNRLGFWGGFSCFVYFIWCQLFACLIRAAIFRLPPAFVVCSFFAAGICVQSLFSTTFSAVGIRVILFLFALLALVSRYQCISQFLVSCSALAARQLQPWRFELEFFPSRLPCGQPYKFCFQANPIWHSAIKFTQLHSVKCSLHKWVWLRRSIKVSSFELYKFDPFLPHSGSIPRELLHSYALGCLWVVTVCCNTVGRHG